MDLLPKEPAITMRIWASNVETCWDLEACMSQRYRSRDTDSTEASFRKGERLCLSRSTSTQWVCNGLPWCATLSGAGSVIRGTSLLQLRLYVCWVTP